MQKHGEMSEKFALGNEPQNSNNKEHVDEESA